MTPQPPIPDPVPDPTDCRIVTYNVIYEGTEPDGHGWDRRRDRVVEELIRLSPDVIAFQEIWLGQLSWLESALPDFSWVAADDALQHTPIAYRSDRFDLVGSGTFWVAPPDADPGVPAWDASYQRLVTHATLRDKNGGPEWSVFSIHLDHEGEQARLEGAGVLRERVDEIAPDSEVVVAGDFNCPPGSPPHERLGEDGSDGRPLSDAVSVADTVSGPEETFIGLSPEDEPQNIDHVFVSDELAVERVITCVPATEDTNPPSDHRPVLVDLRY